MIGQRIPTLALAVLAAGCASADRDGARALATAGIDGTTAISREVSARADRVAGRVVVQNFNFAYSTMRFCDTITTTGVTEPREAAACDVLAAADRRSREEVPAQLMQLSRIVRLRARAIDQLTGAYRALAAEADFDARGQFETAIGGATESTNALAGALGLGPIPQVAGAVLRIGGGQLAANAQQRRLMAASVRLRTIAEHLRTALAAEQSLHQQVDEVADTIEEEARRNLVQEGLLAPLPPLKEVVAASGFPSPGDSALQAALSRSERLRAAALVASLAGRPEELDAALTASIGVLDELIESHREFEARRGLSLSDLSASIVRLTEIVNAAKADLESNETDEDSAPESEE